MLAAEHGRLEVVQVLVQAGADFLTKNKVCDFDPLLPSILHLGIL
jgi:hypothetical protein